MALGEAWSTLGLDLARVKASILQVPVGRRDRVAEKSLIKARKVARRMMADYHPDRHKGEDAGKIFKKVQDAMASIEFHTDEFRRKLTMESRRVGFIVMDGTK